MMAEIIEGVVHHFSHGASSPLDRLPPAGRQVLRRLMDQKADLYAAHLALSERLEEARQKARRLQRRIEILTDPMRARDHGWQPLPLDDPRLQAERSSLEAIQADVTEMQNSLTSRSEKLADIRRMVERLLRYVERLRDHKIVAAPAVLPRLSKNADLRAEVERARRQIAKLRADLREIEAAPYPSVTAKSRAREAVEALAERGRPNVLGMIQHGENTPTWPSLSLRVGLSASVATPQATHPVIGLGHVEHADALAITAWLQREVLIAKLEAEIDEHADDAKALTDVERAAKVAEVKSTILAVEHEEEAIIRQLERDGTEYARRIDVDPRAILSLGSEAPAPKE